MDIKGMRFGIMGLARSGIAAALKVLANGGNVFISEIKYLQDSKKEIIKNYGEATWQKLLPYCEFGQHSSKLFDADYLIVSPGIPTDNHTIKTAQLRNIKTISEIEFAYLIKEQTSKIIAVTGSNGKSTTVSLINHLLQNAGYKTILAGNIGNPLSSFPIEKPGLDYIVLELSSFQLELIEKFTPDTAVFLNISTDHLDRHRSMENYLDTKMKIFMNQRAKDKAILNSEDRHIMSKIDTIASHKSFFAANKESLPCESFERAYLEDHYIIWSQPKNRGEVKVRLDTAKAQLPGVHNRMNMMASILAVGDAVNEQDLIAESLRTFTPLPHRLEKIAEIDGIEFINDSKATNTESVRFALTAFDKDLHLITGGYEKGEDYSILLPYLNENVKRIYLIGNSKSNMQLSWQSLSNKISAHRTLIEAVQVAYSEASEGEIILLSPACASYDMYKNFEHRGNVFRTIVKELEKK